MRRLLPLLSLCLFTAWFAHLPALAQPAPPDPAAGRLPGWATGRLPGWATERLPGWAAGGLPGWATAGAARLCSPSGTVSR